MNNKITLNSSSQTTLSCEKIQTDLQKIDYRGSFESDDETGTIFEQIKLTINQLNRFKGEEQ